MTTGVKTRTRSGKYNTQGSGTSTTAIGGRITIIVIMKRIEI
jgi:hypothetical protein